ncbi:hypothetical protein BpHYR1_051356 [Brachionus plicatilis]|uniref:Uncharacterized protein n=1 Tax=Brachionus plicatilis TaxID=10195 RepID=A0A3M7PWE6_BRAPC|nr:hypothetical protein BpHYR1_051356 [Brachionus plicatilis]
MTILSLSLLYVVSKRIKQVRITKLVIALIIELFGWLITFKRIQSSISGEPENFSGFPSEYGLFEIVKSQLNKKQNFMEIKF